MYQMQKRQKRIPAILRKMREVTAYFERDDNSRLKADKKTTITRKGCKKQIRLLIDDIKHIHATYLADSNKKIRIACSVTLSLFVW